MAGMGKLLKQAQKMQEEMEKIQQELNEEHIVGEAGGGVVKATVTGSQELVSIKINPEVIQSNDAEMLEDLIVSAVNQAMAASKEQAQQRMQKVYGQLNFPGLPGM